MVVRMDHKRAYDHDEGLEHRRHGHRRAEPATTPTTLPPYCMETIFLPTVAAMEAEGRPFKGCLYFGLMLTPNGPKVIEYNCRFGDPETQVVLPLLESDLLTIMKAVPNGTLDETDVKFARRRRLLRHLASGGYPRAYEKGKEITGLPRTAAHADVTVLPRRHGHQGRHARHQRRARARRDRHSAGSQERRGKGVRACRASILTSALPP